MSENRSGTQNEADWRRSQLHSTLNHWEASGFNPNVVLGVPRTASLDQIETAHRRCIAAYHPDRNNSAPLATELAKRVNAARDELLEKGRRRYQSQREQQRKQDEERQQQNPQGWRARSTQGQTHRGGNYRRNSVNTGNSQSWSIVVLVMVTLIAIYLILTVTAPDAIDSLMEDWARLFN